MSDLRDLADRIERLVLRHEELKRTNELLTQEVATLEVLRNAVVTTGTILIVLLTLIAALVSPPTARRVSATADDGDREGWAHRK